MQNLIQIANAYPSVKLSLVRYGLNNAKTFNEVCTGMGTCLRTWAHNPFGSQDQFNKALQDRELEFFSKPFLFPVRTPRL